MAVSAFVSTFTARTSNGSQAYTGVGFQPKGLIVWSNNSLANSSTGGFSFTLGAAASSTSRCVGYGNVDTSLSSGSYAAGIDNTKVYESIIGSTNTISSAADLTSFDADGFTLNWTTTDATARVANYLALGGADITNVFVGNSLGNSANGSQAITGVGFQPDTIIFFACRTTSTAPISNTSGSSARPTIGFASSSSNRGVVHSQDKYDTVASRAASQSYQVTSSVLAWLNEANDSGTMSSEADLTSFDSDGFTLNWTTTNGTGRYFYYICIKGGRFKVGTFNQATSTGNQATTGAGFTPVALMLASRNKTSGTSVTGGSRFSLGAGVSSSARASMWTGGSNTGSPTNNSRDLDSTKIIKMMTESGTTPTTQAAADLVSLDSDGFTVNWSTVDATAREVMYFAIGNTPTATTVGTPAMAMMGIGG